MCRKTEAKALVQDVKITRHADDQMTARGIPYPVVLAVIANGVWVPNHENELIYYDGWCVVMDENRVITVFYRDKWNHKRCNFN